jgi:hypothetical protein
MDKRANAGARGSFIVPVDRDEDPAGDLRGGYIDPKHGTPMRRAHPATRPSFAASSGFTSTKGSGM